MKLHRGQFRADELVEVVHKNPVILNSGGPIMELEAVEDGPDGERAVCSWDHGKSRSIFPVACLSRPVPLEANPVIK